MNHFHPRVSGPLGRLLLIAVLVSMTIGACGTPEGAAPPSQARQAPTAPALQAAQPTPRTQEPAAQPTASVDPQQGQTAPAPVPACTFAGTAGAEPQVPVLDAYTFSEPKIVLTDKLIGINEWLPDSRRLLVTRPILEGSQEVIETLDVQTGATERYAEQSHYRTKPVWLEAEQAVAFAEIRSNNQVVLRIGRGKGLPVDDVVADLVSPYLAVTPDGQQVAFVSRSEGGQLRALNVGQGRQVRSLARPAHSQAAGQAPVQLEQWEALRAAWRPNGKQIALYNKTSFYLTDTTTGQVCDVDLGGDTSGKRWALKAIWSPDGRFLAALTSIGGVKGRLPFADITVLDTATGKLGYLTLNVQYIYEFTWLPNSQQIVALGQFDRASEYVNPSLFFADVRTGDFQHVLPDHTFGSGIYSSEGGGLAITPDGQNIAVKCSLPQEDRLCIITFQTRP
jgi:Tol biopolymer transport system component